MRFHTGAVCRYPSAVRSKKVVCFVTADYIKSEFCMKEFAVAESKKKLLVVCCEPISDITSVDPGEFPEASNALAYLDIGGQVICPDGKVFGGKEDVIQKIMDFA